MERISHSIAVLLLSLPDEILVVDVLSNAAWKLIYDFTIRPNGGSTQGGSTHGLPREGESRPYVPKPEAEIARRRDHAPGVFAEKVLRAKEEFKVGNLFETVLSQVRAPRAPPPLSSAPLLRPGPTHACNPSVLSQVRAPRAPPPLSPTPLLRPGPTHACNPSPPFTSLSTRKRPHAPPCHPRLRPPRRALTDSCLSRCADLLRAMPSAAVGAVPPVAHHQPVALRIPHQSGRGRVPGGRVTRDVCARREEREGVALRDLPDLRDDPARRQRARGCGEY